MKKIIIENGKVVSTSGEINDNVIKDLSEADVGHNNEDDNYETVTITDSKTNIKLNTTNDIVPVDAKMEITEITSGAIFDEIKNKLTELKNFRVYDITLKVNDSNIQPNGKVKISIPIPENFDISRLVIYRLEEDGTKIEYQVTIENEYATFETDYFSTYILGEKFELFDEAQENIIENGEQRTTEKNDNKLPQTGTEEGNKFTKWLTAVIFLGIFWLISMLLIDYKKEKINQSQKGGKHNGSR